MLTERMEWRDLADAHWIDQQNVAPTPRGLSAAGITLDYSRHRIDDAIFAKLCALADACDVAGWREKMFTGEKINTAENRAVLHTALRAPHDADIRVDGENVMPFVHDVLAKMENFTRAVHDGEWRGFDGQKIKTIVNIGIGGSDLGPRMVCHALRRARRADMDVHFISNVDGADCESVLAQCDPATTLFLIASKTFTTQETMMNARTARDWLIAGAGGDHGAVQKHFVALSTNEQAVKDFGIDPAHMFAFRDWVGGRYSLWSAIGLPIALATDFATFRALLDGAQAMDQHFRTAPTSRNMPVILALLGIWYRNFQGAQSYGVIPYSRDLALLPAWLQQTDMESNGKSVTRDGTAAAYATGPIVFGAAGTDAQHAFFQLIHQGTALIPCDFITCIAAPSAHADHHRVLTANMIAQAEALWHGRGLAESGNDPQKTFAGRKPSSLLLLRTLDAWHLGALLALYEHKVFVQGIIWNINSYDQWGVELGKVLASRILESGDNPLHTILDRFGVA